MKKLLFLLVFIPLVFACSDDSNSDDEVYIEIGDFYQGGIVFQKNSNGTGKVASIGDLGQMTRLQGVDACEDFVFEGYHNWYLPDIGELSLMFNTIGQGADNIGDFADARYWSSTNFNNNSGSTKSFNFATGESESGWNSVLNFRIRAVRSFD